LDLLEELLLEFDGTLLLVSHDREFLDHVTTSTLALEGEGRIVETVGGYSEWERVSKAGAAATEPKPAKEKRDKSSSDKSANDKPRKLSFKEKKELEELPARIESLEGEMKQLHAQLADPDLYRTAPEKVAPLTERLEAVEAELPGVYARWEELESRE